jgi:hypothetical protein
MHQATNSTDAERQVGAERSPSHQATDARSRGIKFPISKASIGRIVLVMIGLCVIAASAASKVGPVLTLVKDGQPYAVIVVGQKASKIEKYAAEELQLYLEKISGAKVPVQIEGTQNKKATEIVIGTPKTNKYIASAKLIKESSLGRDGLLIKTVGNKILLAGESPPGALYATYALLEEHLGCRWYFPGEQGEYVPAMKTITIAQIDDKQKPAIQFRGLYATSGGSKNLKIGTWLARNRMNLIGQTIINSYHRKNADDSIKRGLVFNTETLFHHWLHKGKLFETHPEYFPLFDGKRSKGFPSGWAKGQLQQYNYCLSNPELVKEAAKSIREFAKLYPDVEMIGVNQQDSDKWCQCGPCKALGAPTDRLHTFLNRLVKELGPVLDNRLLSTHAYQSTGRQPIKVKPNEKIVIFYTLISHCARHGWDEECPKQESQKKQLAGWLKYGNKVIVYTYHAECFTGFPMPMAYHSLAGMKYYKQIGISGWYPETSQDAPGQKPLKRDPELIWGDSWYSMKETYYTAAKALWNSDVTLEGIKDDFFPKFYGKAGPAMRKYYDALEKAWHYPGEVRLLHKRVYGYNPSTGIDFLNPALINTMNGHLAEARTLSAGESEVVKGRVERDIGLFAKWEKRYKDTGGKATRR